MTLNTNVCQAVEGRVTTTFYKWSITYTNSGTLDEIMNFKKEIMSKHDSASCVFITGLVLLFYYIQAILRHTI